MVELLQSTCYTFASAELQKVLYYSTSYTIIRIRILDDDDIDNYNNEKYEWRNYFISNVVISVASKLPFSRNWILFYRNCLHITKIRVMSLKEVQSKTVDRRIKGGVN